MTRSRTPKLILIVAVMLTAMVASMSDPSNVGATETPPLTTPATAADDESLANEVEATEALRHAEQLVAKNRHKKAVTAYRTLSRKYAGTAAAKIAAERLRPTAFIGWSDILRSGPSRNRVDVAVMGDGYELKKQSEFDDIAKTVPRVFEHNKTLGEYLAYFNFVHLNLVSAEAGIDGFNREFDTALGGFVRGTIQGHVGTDRSLVQKWLAELPEHDGLAIAYVKRGDLGTGGGGVATIGGRNDPTTVHEWGHAFVGLGDEYTQNTGHRGAVRRRINISNTDDPERVPWRHWLEAKVKGLGVYQGADGRVKGAWKARASSCVMENGSFFCRVCREAMVLRIYEYVDPIDEWSSVPNGPLEPSWTPELAEPFTGVDPHEFQLRVMQPDEHDLQVHWWVLENQRAVPAAKVVAAGRSRLERGPLVPIEVKPTDRSRPNSSGLHRFTVKPDELSAGLYRVVCRVVDTAEMKGDKWPWVLKDDDGLLQSERGWWILVE